MSASLRNAIQSRFGVRHCSLTSTGRAGMTVLLTALRTLAHRDRDEVVLPSYTCFSVAASIVKAGLRPRIVDVSPETLDYDLDQLRHADLGRALAVVATNLYGLPNDVPAISGIARAQGAFVIDDAAQAMGARMHGQPCGSRGDVGLFSLDKGKTVAAIDGGIVVTNSDEIAAAIAQVTTGLSRPGVAESCSGIAKALVYSAFLRPSLYWIPNRVPQLGLGKTPFTTDFPLALPSRPLVALGRTMFDHLDALTQARQTTAAALLSGLRETASVRTIAPAADAQPAYPRLPILMADAGARDRALARLTSAGIGATGSYPASIAEIPELRSAFRGPVSAAGGRHVARHILTLPTHAFVTGTDVARMILCLGGERVDASAATALTT